MGAKTIAGAMSVREFSYLISLFDQGSAELVALLDGNSITGYRTAATSALAADLLAPPGPLTVAVIGSGFEAKKHVRALAAVRELKSVQVFSPRAESRERFACELADLGTAIVPAESPEAAVAGTSLVICAARSYDETPILLGRWLEPGMTVVSIGSTVREQREVDAEVDRPRRRRHRRRARRGAPRHRRPRRRAAGRHRRPPRIASLADLVGGRAAGRTSADADRALQVRRLGGPGPRRRGDVRAPARDESGVGATLPIRIQPVRK